MAFSKTFAFTISLILFSFMIAIASASDYGYGAKPAAPAYKPKSDVKEKPLPIGVEGIILCRSGYKTFPIKGAIARITCLAVDENGYEAAPFSILSKETDSKGYYFATLFPNVLNNKLKLSQCKAFLEKSPLETCKIATDVNKGISGAPISYCHLLQNKKIKLYKVPPFIYTTSSSTPKPISNGY
ncbi:Pollen Ole e 1 allergen/extensin [Corchorus olitorius]|uniref:Pollen Ole e 1 allergen/extensin n=1 Tax=Corchorus olitorius TaxID=93759 RepID=A0A1R3KFY2_9ROSI|nr:Pollen Ole e 1 allergen/extensin [Corchorus olitorius]